MIELKVAVDKQMKGSRRVKTRRFSATALGYIVADQLWDGGYSGADMRPVFLALAGKESTLRPFVANLRAGRQIQVQGHAKRGWDANASRLKFLKKTNYQKAEKKLENGMLITTFFLPEVFRVEAGLLDELRCKLLAAPPLWWIDKQAAIIAQDGALVKGLEDHLRACGMLSEEAENLLGVPEDITISESQIPQIAAVAVHWNSLLDKKTALPLIDDMRFAVQIYYAALAQGVSSEPVRSRYNTKGKWTTHATFEGFFVDGGSDMGFGPVVCTDVGQDYLAQFLARQVRLYNSLIGG